MMQCNNLWKLKCLQTTQQIKDSDDQTDKLGKIEPVKGKKIRMKMVRTAPIETGTREVMQKRKQSNSKEMLKMSKMKIYEQ